MQTTQETPKDKWASFPWFYLGALALMMFGFAWWQGRTTQGVIAIFNLFIVPRWFWLELQRKEAANARP